MKDYSLPISVTSSNVREATFESGPVPTYRGWESNPPKNPKPDLAGERFSRPFHGLGSFGGSTRGYYLSRLRRS